MLYSLKKMISSLCYCRMLMSHKDCLIVYISENKNKASNSFRSTHCLMVCIQNNYSFYKHMVMRGDAFFIVSVERSVRFVSKRMLPRYSHVIENALLLITRSYIDVLLSYFIQ